MEMKIYKLLSVILGSAMSFAFSSCENASNSFPDYEGGVSVYFAYQYPVRTIVLGNDPVVDNSLTVSTSVPFMQQWEGHTVEEISL